MRHYETAPTPCIIYPGEKIIRPKFQPFNIDTRMIRWSFDFLRASLALAEVEVKYDGYASAESLADIAYWKKAADSWAQLAAASWTLGGIKTFC